MENKAKLWQVIGLDHMEMLTGCFSSQIFPWHSHDTYCLSVIESGVEMLEIAGKKLMALPGSILLIPPNLLHSNYAHNEQGYKLRTFYINPELFDYSIHFKDSPVKKNMQWCSYNIDSPALYNSLLTIHQSLEQYNSNPSLRENLFLSLQRLESLLAATHRIDAALPKSDKVSAKVLPFIEKQLSNKITLQQLASLVKVSKFQLVRYFKNETGVTPFEYILQRRIELAKKRLKNGDPIVIAALDSGFYDQCHFSHYFKWYVGVTPFAYRKACNILQDF